MKLSFWLSIFNEKKRAVNFDAETMHIAIQQCSDWEGFFFNEPLRNKVAINHESSLAKYTEDKIVFFFKIESLFSLMNLVG